MKTLLLSTVSEFFRRRAGTFLVLAGILFGFLSAAEHHAFAVFFLTGSYGMVFLLAIWLAYSLICSQFVFSTWQQPEYTFIYNARIWPPLLRFGRLLLLSFGFLQPILFYGIYLFVIAVQDHFIYKIWPVFPFYFLLALLISGVAEWRLRNPVRYVRRQASSFFKWPFARPVSWLYWALEWLIRERGITLLVGKLGAILVAAGTMLYYSTDQYDLRLPAVGLSFAYLLNSGISMELYKWESEVCLWERSMPVSSLRRFARVLAFHAIVILPEILVAIRNATLNAGEIGQLYLLGLTIVTLSHLILYKKQSQPDDLARIFLFGFIGLTLLILYKIPLLVLVLAGMLFSAWIYPRWYKI
jgi:hypothetical protein